MKTQAFRTILLSACVIGFGVGLFSQTRAGDLSIFTDLVGLVSESSDSVAEMPEDLLKVVANYYAEEVVPERVTTDVLSYLTGVYSEHGYNEYGGWVASSSASPWNRRRNGNPHLFRDYKVPSDFIYPSYSDGDFKMPINGVYTSFFGYRPKFGRFHKGIDISLKTGDTVRCSLPGIVVRTKCDPDGYGNYVVVSHDNELETLYAHLTYDLVEPGQQLKAGDAIGLGGTTGNATGPHLHFETRLRGEAIDPLNYLPNKAVRK